MQKIKYPLIISDFDGTLLRSDDQIANETKKAIDEYVHCGGRFCICTGRMLGSIIPKAKALGLSGLVASFQGAVVADIQTGKVLLDGGMSAQDGAEICRFCEEMGWHTHVYALDVFYSNMQDKALEDYERITGIKGCVVNDEPLWKFIEEKGEKVRKILLLVSPKDKQQIYQILHEKFGENYYVTYSAAFLVEISPKQYSKATAVQFMADHYGIDVENVIAVGDSLNDMPMIERAGAGVAMKNADDALKAVADVVLNYSNDENGIGHVISDVAYEGEV